MDEQVHMEWVVCLPLGDIEHVTYGQPVQCVVNAVDAATARERGHKLLGGDASVLTVTPLTELGEAAQGPGVGNWDNLPAKGA